MIEFSERMPTLTPDTSVRAAGLGCEVPVLLRRPVCDAHLDEMNIAAQLSTDRRRPDCGELLLFAVLLHECIDAGR
jgi:hypothetical protein